MYPTTLGGVQVFFNNRPAPLLYVSANLINTVVSDNPEFYFGPETVGVILNGAKVAELAVPLTANMPGIFINPDGSAIAVNQDGTLNSRTNPAKDGSTVSIFGTGVTSLMQFEQQPTVELQFSPQASYQLTFANCPTSLTCLLSTSAAKP